MEETKMFPMKIFASVTKEDAMMFIEDNLDDFISEMFANNEYQIYQYILSREKEVSVFLAGGLPRGQ